MKHFVMVLNDKETWTNVEDCMVLVFDEEPTDEMIKNHEIHNVVGVWHVNNGVAELITWKKTDQVALEINVIGKWDS